MAAPERFAEPSDSPLAPRAPSIHDAKRSRPSIGKPAMSHPSKERVLLIGTDQRITSGPAARTAAFRGRIHGCTRTIRRTVRFSSCTAGAVHTWHIASIVALIGRAAIGG